MSLCAYCERPGHFPVTERSDEGYYNKMVRVCARHLKAAFADDKSIGISSSMRRTNNRGINDTQTGR